MGCCRCSFATTRSEPSFEIVLHSAKTLHKVRSVCGMQSRIVLSSQLADAAPTQKVQNNNELRARRLARLKCRLLIDFQGFHLTLRICRCGYQDLRTGRRPHEPMVRRRDLCRQNCFRRFPFPFPVLKDVHAQSVSPLAPTRPGTSSCYY